ncbi:hypothetical protein AB6A40_010412 [Gnathostoma spinigerum]|uniref:FERM domain-containing protein n=1 Tax=Gnathostoma spinigerum TaxID=75299 RepID=A0ABD6EV72_9BILA
MGSDTPAAAISKSPDGSEKLANDKNLQAATVEFLDSTSHVFYVPKKAEGFELFDKVASHINLNEKEYFALSYDDTNGQRHWLRDSKRIAKQLKGHPWQFNFEVKFYPPDPSSLTDDSARYQLYLQVRNDIFTGR